MKVAVFSDIHGNCVGLEAMLEDLAGESIDQWVCLGDAIQGGAQPSETVARLRALNCPVVMGNADAWLLTGIDAGMEQIDPARMQTMMAVREWSLSQLSQADRDFISGFQPHVNVKLPGGRTLLCFHGSPTSFHDVLLPETPDRVFRAVLGSWSGDILCGGHTHVQYIRRLGDQFFFNPGSVGFAYSHHQSDHDFRADPWAEYAVLTVDERRVGLEFRRVPLDLDVLLAVFSQSGRPHIRESLAQYGR